MSENGKRAGLIRHSQVSTVLNSAVVPAVATTVVALILTFVLAESVDTWTLTVWLAAVCLLNAYRYIASKPLAGEADDPKNTDRIARQLLIMIAASGCLWGFAGGYFFPSDAILYQVLLGFALGGLVAGSLSTYGVWLSAFYAYAVPSMLPIVLRFFMEATDAALAMGGMLAIFWLAEAALAHSVNRSLIRSIELQLDKDELVKNLTDAKSIAEDASQAKDQFLSRISHELRTPMHAILGFGQLLSVNAGNNADSKSSQQEAIDHIMRAGRHLLNLIDEMLDLAKVNTGEINVDKRPVDTQAILEECIDIIRPSSTDRGIELVTPNRLHLLPAVLADELRLREVFLNLLSNAVKYNRPGGKITIEAQPANNDRLRIAIFDTGIGIPADQTDRIFQPFRRLDRQFFEVEGSGLGLSITKQLVELMDGTIGFNSTENEGSLFWIEIPLAPDKSAPPVATNRLVHSPAVDEGDDGLLPMSILYVEDNQTNQQLLIEVCALRDGITIDCTDNAEAGLEYLSDHPVDLVLMDIQLPDMDGYDALKKIRTMPEMVDTPVIALSANAMPSDVRKGLDAGFLDYLTKPIEIDNFLSVLDDLRLKR